MKFFVFIVILILNITNLFAQTNSCVYRKEFNDSTALTFFCPDFNFTTYELWEIRYFAGFNYTDSFKLAYLDTNDINFVEKQLPVKIKEFNKNKQVGSCIDIDQNLGKYQRQYFCFTDKKGDKVLLINFLYFFDKNSTPNLIRPAFYTDGCTRFWKIKFNLKTKTFYDFQVNGRS